MKKTIGAVVLALIAVAILVSEGQAKAIHWNVKCITPSHGKPIKPFEGASLRKGIDCAHMMRKGENWKFPKGVRDWSPYAPSGRCKGQPIGVIVGGMTPFGPGYIIGGAPMGWLCPVPAGFGTYQGGVVHASKKMLVVAGRKSFPVVDPMAPPKKHKPKPKPKAPPAPLSCKVSLPAPKPTEFSATDFAFSATVTCNRAIDVRATWWLSDGRIRKEDGPTDYWSMSAGLPMTLSGDMGCFTETPTTAPTSAIVELDIPAHPGDPNSPWTPLSTTTSAPAPIQC